MLEAAPLVLLRPPVEVPLCPLDVEPVDALPTVVEPVLTPPGPLPGGMTGFGFAGWTSCTQRRIVESQL